jgi:nucleoid DNA-binding protein
MSKTKAMNTNDKLTFSQMVERVAAEAKVSKSMARKVLKEMSSIIDGQLRDGSKVSISRLGIFKLKWQAARKGRNPQTGEPIEIPPQNRVVFKPAAALRRFINRNHERQQPEIIDDKKDVPGFHTEKPDSGKKFSSMKWAGLSLVLLLIIFSGIFYLFQSLFKLPAKVQETTLHQAVKALDPSAEQSFPDKRSDHPPFQPDVSPVSSTGFTNQHQYSQTVIPGDTLWMISKAFYTDPYLWPNIFRANLAIMHDPDTLIVGTKIYTPPLEGTANHLTAKDISHISEGYYQVYLAYKRLGKKNAPLFLRVSQQFNKLKASTR